MRKALTFKQGFTLIELLVAATIIVLLTAIGLVSFSVANRQARDAKRKADLEQVRAALEIYRSDNPSYPAGAVVGNLGTIAGLSAYLTSSNLADPKDVVPYRYAYTPGAGNTTYTVCATLEITGAATCLNSP
jgi:prepilin-type N-terminal cleavage/methylation domain-containing protein